MDRAKTERSPPEARLERGGLAQSAAARLREIILEREPGAQIGSLHEVGELLGVGIVTVQQAARILEHEGLLEVRRGPGGGYYGARPDVAALERSVAAYWRVHGARFDEVTEMMSLLDCEIIPAAALCEDGDLHEQARQFRERIESCRTEETRIAFEQDFHKLLFQMSRRPFVELLMRVAMSLYSTPPKSRLFGGEEGVMAWKTGKVRVIDAILKRDEELARFEAMRYRQELLARLRKAAPSV